MADKTRGQRLTMEELDQRMKEGWQPYVIDVQQAHEEDFVEAEFVDRYDPNETIVGQADRLPRNKDVLVYCRDGRLGEEVCDALQAKAGIDGGRIYNLEGDYDEIRRWMQVNKGKE